MIRVGIIGISGYSGAEVLDILLKHPEVRINYVGANTTTGPVNEIWPKFKGRTNLVCEPLNIEKACADTDLIFLAVPHTTSMIITPQLLKQKKRVIDLSGDYRLARARDYNKWYGVKHVDKKNLASSVYGLPELYKEKIRKAELIANPGCYPTAALLGLAPLVSLHAKQVKSITIDAKSGVTGAGKKAVAQLMYSEVNENLKAYKIFNHQHTPEIDLYLSRWGEQEFRVTFVPHLVPMNRGIFETIYVDLKNKINIKTLLSIYKKFYKTEPFVRILPEGTLPELKNVNHTNYCDIGLALSPSRDKVIITAAIDNLIKGAAGQAVQNMNLMCQFKENQALT